jgi:YgiT-type zinc finger domain-containing protein
MNVELSACLTCGSDLFRGVVEDVFFPVEGRSVTVPALKHYRCFACGERMFDLDAGEKIDQYCLNTEE